MACRVGGVAGFGSRGARLPAGSDLGCKGPGFDCRSLLDFFALGQLYTDWDTRFAERRVYTYLDGPGEQLTNGGLETWILGVPAGWATYSAATVLQVAGARTGGAGSSVAEVHALVGDGAAGIEQTPPLVTGARYRVRVWGRGDGVNGFPKIRDGAVVTLAVGTTSTDWQYFEVEFTAQSTSLRLETGGNAATDDAAQWDDTSVEELPRAEVLNHPTLAARMLADPAVLDRCDALCAALASCPVWDDEEQALRWMGTSYLVFDALAAKYATEDNPFTALAVVNTADATAQTIANVGRDTTDNRRRDWRHTAAHEQEVRFQAAIGDKTVTGAAGVLTGHKVVAVCVPDGKTCDGWVNGADDISGGDLDVDSPALNQATWGARRGGSIGQYWLDYMSRLALGGAANPDAVKRACSRLMSAHGV